MRRPISITVVGWLFIAVGAGSLARGLFSLRGRDGVWSLAELRTHPGDFALVMTSAALAAGGGVGALRGRNWARWLLAVWMGLHVVVSLMHSVTELIVHCVLFGIICVCLFGPGAAAYFRRADGRTGE